MPELWLRRTLGLTPEQFQVYLRGQIEVELLQDRLIRYARLLTQAQEMMAGDQAAASRWLNEPHPLLDDESPLEHAMTELGARDVEDLITRVQFGVYS